MSDHAAQSIPEETPIGWKPVMRDTLLGEQWPPPWDGKGSEPGWWALHPWYGECDAMGTDGNCGECEYTIGAFAMVARTHPDLIDPSPEPAATEGDKKTPRCSFCGRSKPFVRAMVTGAGVHICNECVEKCVGFMATEGDEEPGWCYVECECGKSVRIEGSITATDAEANVERVDEGDEELLQSIREDYAKLVESDWFKRMYVGKSLGEIIGTEDCEKVSLRPEGDEERSAEEWFVRDRALFLGEKEVALLHPKTNQRVLLTLLRSHPPDSPSVEALRELDAAMGLHEGIEIVYVVDRFEADFTKHDGATSTAHAQGATIFEALTALCATLQPSEENDD